MPYKEVEMVSIRKNIIFRRIGSITFRVVFPSIQTAKLFLRN